MVQRASALILFILFSAKIQATTLMSVSTQDMSQGAAWIGEVEIISVSQRIGAIPMQEFEARVVDVMKGELQTGDSVRFQLPGGRTATRRISVMGMSELKTGVHYIVFLDRAPSSNSVAGLQNWGAYEIREAGDERIAVRAGSLGTARRGFYGALSISHDRSAMKLEDLKSDIFRGLD